MVIFNPKPLKNRQKILRGMFLKGFSSFWAGAGGFFEGFLAALGKVTKHCFGMVFRKIVIS